MAEATIEERTLTIGKELFEHIDTSKPSIFSRRYWDDMVMDWSMSDDNLKIRLFRFIDCLPALKTPEDVLTSLNAYMDESEVKLPRLAHYGMKLARPGSWTGKFVANQIVSNTTRLARRFIAGTNPQEVIASVEKLRRRDVAFTMDLLGEATVTEHEADDYLQQYLDLLDALGKKAKEWTEHPVLDRDHQGSIPPINVSIKMSALYSQFDPIDPEGCLKSAGRRLREVFRSAIKNNAIINLDMEQHDFKDATIELFKSILSEPEFRDWPNVGIAIQAYLRSTEADLYRLRDWAKQRGTGIWVRLVKGAYWDYETVLARQKHWPIPVWTQKWQSDACFERCTIFLMENYQWLRPALAGHNLRSLAHGLAVAEHLRLPKLSYEVQMLYGMADPLLPAFTQRGERVRVYTPFGKLLPGMAYLVRRLLENTSNSSFLRATFSDGRPIEELLKKPAQNSYQLIQTALKREENMATSTSGHDPVIPAFANEPLTDFSRSTNRDQFAQILARVKTMLGREYPLWINGKAQAGNAWIESRNPNDQSMVVGKWAKASIAQADEAVESSAKAFEEWKNWPVLKRAEVLLKVADKMRSRRFELAAWMILECGKQWREADADVAEAIDFCEYYAREMIAISHARHRNVPGEMNEYIYIPRGVVIAIAPWNFPLAILCGMVAAPLVAGNTVIMKPAEQSSIIGALFAELFHDLELPAGTVNLLTGLGEEVGAHVVAHPKTAVITFTGSVPVGLAINKQAATPAPGMNHVKRVVAEMGGKNAIIVDTDADLDEAVRGIIASTFGFQGQKCSACSRVIALANVYDALIARVKDAAASLELGPSEDPTFSLGAVIDKESQTRLLDAINRGKQEAKLLFGSTLEPKHSVGHFVPPHIFYDVDPKSFLMQDEFFGPILAITKVPDLETALKVANDTRYALTGGIFSRNPKTIERVKHGFEVGNLYINRKITGAEVDRQPFGGFKLSGIGAKAGGPDYLKQFMVPRTITENTLRHGFSPDDLDALVQ